MTQDQLSKLQKNLTECKEALKTIKLCYTGQAGLSAPGINPQAPAVAIYNCLENYATRATVKILTFSGHANKKCADPNHSANQATFNNTHKLAFEALTFFVMAVDGVLNAYTEAQHASLDNVLQQFSALAKDMLLHLNNILKLLASAKTPGYNEQHQQHTKTLQQISQLLLKTSSDDNQNHVSDEPALPVATLVLAQASATLSLPENIADADQTVDGYWPNWSYERTDTSSTPSSRSAMISTIDWKELRDSLNIPINSENKMLSNVQSLDKLFTATLSQTGDTTFDLDTTWTATLQNKQHATTKTVASFISSPALSQTSASTPLASSSQQSDLPTIPPTTSSNHQIFRINETVAAIKIFCESYPSNKPTIIQKLETATAKIETEDNMIVLQTIQQLINNKQITGRFFQNLWLTDQRTDQFYQQLKKLDPHKPNTMKNLIDFIMQNLVIKPTPIMTAQYL